MDNTENIKSKCFSVYSYLKFIGEYSSDQLTDSLDCSPNKINILHSTTTKLIESLQQKLATYASDLEKLSMPTLSACSSVDSLTNANSSNSTIIADINDIKKDSHNLSLKKTRSVEEYTDDDFLESFKLHIENTKVEQSKHDDQMNDNESKPLNSSNSTDSDETYCPEIEDNEVDETVLFEMFNRLGEDDEDISFSSNSNINQVDYLSDSYSDLNPLSTSSSSSLDSEDENYKYTDEDYCEINGIKPCSVLLTEIFNKKPKVTISEHEKEMREIDRLTNMKTLENPKPGLSITGNDTIPSKKRKRLHRDLETDEDSDASTVPIVEEEYERIQDLDQLMCMEDLCNDNDESDDFSHEERILAALGQSSKEDNDESSLSEGDENKPKLKRMHKKIKRRNIRILSSSSSEGRDLTRPDWNKDPLLTVRLSPILDDSEEEECDDDSLLKIAKEEIDDQDSIKKIENNRSPTEFVSLDSASESDCEFVGNISTPISKINKGRKNIRAIKTNKELEENTQLAQQDEKEHIQRVSQQTKRMESISQQSDFNNEDLVLDVDDQCEPLIVVDGQLSKKLKNHQKDGIRFMWSSCFESVASMKLSKGTGCILAHCMGLGKTLQAITLTHTLFKYKQLTRTKHVLIVCPLSTVQNWKHEFRIALKDAEDVDINVQIMGKNLSKARKEYAVAHWHNEGGVLILGYESFACLVKDLSKADPTTLDTSNVKYKALLNPGPDLIICDEGHLIRNKVNNRSMCLYQVKTRRRIILTGTPFQNNLEEMYYMVNFVKPNFLGTKDEFMNRFGNPISNGGYFDSTEADIKLMQKRSHVLHKYLNTTVQRYEATELIKYIPEKHDFTILITLHPTQVELYNKYLSLVKSSTGISSGRFLLDYITLRNVWSHPRLLRERDAVKTKETNKGTDDDVIITNNVQQLVNNWYHSSYPDDIDLLDFGPKLAIVMSIIEECEAIGEKIVIFASSLLNLNCVEHFLKTKGTTTCKSWIPNVDYVRMDGSVPLDVRDESCKRFATEKTLRVFLLSQKVGGLGLNFIAANRLILIDVHFNPAVDNQTVYRIVRFGQKRKCYIYRLVSKCTMEETVYERSITKASISARVVDVKQIKRYFKRHDLETMYRFSEIPTVRPNMSEPQDAVLSKVMQKHKEIFQYYDYPSLLANQPHEQLNESEQQAAWEEFETERENANQIQIQQKTATANLQQNYINPAQMEQVTSTKELQYAVNLNLNSEITILNEVTSSAQTTNIHSIKEGSKNGTHEECVLIVNDQIITQIDNENVNRPEILNRTDKSLTILPVTTTSYKMKSKNKMSEISLQNPSGSKIGQNLQVIRVKSPAVLNTIQSERSTSIVTGRMSAPALPETTKIDAVLANDLNAPSTSSFHVRTKFISLVNRRKSTASDLNEGNKKGRSDDVIEID